MAKKPAAPQWYDQRLGAALLWVAAWLLAYVAGLKALDTAAVVYYLALFALFIYGLNRLTKFLTTFKRV